MAVELDLQVRRLIEAAAALILRKVVIAHPDRERTNHLPVPAYAGHELIGHAAEHGFDIILIGHVRVEGALVTVGLGRRAFGNNRARVLTEGETMQLRCAVPDKEGQGINIGLRDLPDPGKPGCIHSPGGAGTDAGQAAIGQGVEKAALLAGKDLDEARGLAQLRGDLADQLVARQALADRNL